MELENSFEESINYNKLEEILILLKFLYLKDKIVSSYDWDYQQSYYDVDAKEFIERPFEFTASVEYNNLQTDWTRLHHISNYTKSDEAAIDKALSHIEESSKKYNKMIIETILNYSNKEYEKLILSESATSSITAKKYRTAIDFIGNNTELLIELSEKYITDLGNIDYHDIFKDDGLLESDIAQYANESNVVISINSRVANNFFDEFDKVKSDKNYHDFLLMDPIIWILKLEKMISNKKNKNFCLQFKNEKMVNIFKNYLAEYDNVIILTDDEVELSETLYDIILKSYNDPDVSKSSELPKEYSYGNILNKLKEEGKLGLITNHLKLVEHADSNSNIVYFTKINISHNCETKSFYFELSNIKNKEVTLVTSDSSRALEYKLEKNIFSRDLKINPKFIATDNHKIISEYEASNKLEKTLYFLSKNIFYGKSVRKDETDLWKNITVLNISNIKDKKINFHNVSRMKGNIKKLNNYILEDRDILLPVRGNSKEFAIYKEEEWKSYIKDIIDKEEYLRGYTKELDEEQIIIASSNILIIRLKDTIDPDLIKLFLEKTDFGQIYLEKASLGESTTFLDIEVIKDMIIPLDSLKKYREDLKEIEIKEEKIQREYDFVKSQFNNLLLNPEYL